jgi:hypothetical protein
MKNILKTLLRKNELTPDPNDLIAVVSPMGKIDKSVFIQYFQFMIFGKGSCCRIRVSYFRHLKAYFLFCSPPLHIAQKTVNEQERFFYQIKYKHQKSKNKC